jgi:hypothetical protein
MPSYVQFVGRTTNTSHCDIRLNVGIPVPDNVSFTIKATAPSSNEATITIFVEKYSLPHTYQISSNTGTHVIPIGDSSTPSLRVTFYVDATPFTTS